MLDSLRRRHAADVHASPRAWPGKALGERLYACGVRPDTVTLVGVLLALSSGAAVALGHLLLGAGLLACGGIMDAVDGAVAKAGSSATARGAFLDSVADRVSDATVLCGLVWYLLAGPSPKEALLPTGILAVSNLISYQRAKAESLGLEAGGGLMERAERLVLLAAALVFSEELGPLLVALLTLSSLTALGRFSRVWRRARRTHPEAGRSWPGADSGTSARHRPQRATARRARRGPRPRLGGQERTGERSGRSPKARHASASATEALRRRVGWP